MTPEHQFRVLPIEAIMGLGMLTEDGSPRIEAFPCLSDVDVPIPSLSYGQKKRPDPDTSEWPSGGWEDTSYTFANGLRYVIRDAIVHGEQGIITVGNNLIAESLYYAVLPFTDFKPVEDFVVSLSSVDASVEVMTASYMLCGFVSNRNYTHWWIDVMTTFQGSKFGSAYDNSVLLLPQLRARFQKSSLELLPEISKRALFVGEKTRVFCHELTFLPSLVASDLTPHPGRRVLLNELRTRAGASLSQKRRIYINRKDAGARRLVNESEIIEWLELRGFESVTLSGMSIVEQIKLFADASHVIGAHGAGLGNVIFCLPGAKLLELHMGSKIIWSIRRLAALAEMEYGVVLGDVVFDSEDIDSREWHLQIEKLAEAFVGYM